MIVQLMGDRTLKDGTATATVILLDNSEAEYFAIKQAVRTGKQIALVVMEEVKPSDDIIPVVSLIEDIIKRKCDRCNAASAQERKELLDENNT